MAPKLSLHYGFVLLIATAALASYDYSSPHYFQYNSHRAPPLISMDLDPQHQINSSFRIAARENRLSDMELLLKEGAQINSESDEGETALMYAARNCEFRIASSLVHEGAQPNLRDHFDRTALMDATIESCLPVVKLLLKVPGVQLSPRDKSGNTALDYATDNATMDVDGAAAQVLRVLERHERNQGVH